jgi:hypothetical protein
VCECCVRESVLCVRESESLCVCVECVRARAFF